MAFWSEAPLEQINALRAQRGVSPLTAAEQQALILQSSQHESDLGFVLGGFFDAAEAPIDFVREAWHDKNFRVFALAVAGGVAGGIAAGPAAGEAGAAAGEAGAGAAAGGEAAAGAAASESVVFDYSYLDALEAGDAFYGNEVFTAAAVEAAPAASGFWDKALDAGTELAKKYAAAEIASHFAPETAQRDISSRLQPAGGVPLVRYSGQSGDALGSLLSPSALKTLLTLGVVGLVGVAAWRISKK